MVFALYASSVSILFMYLFEDNMWAFMFFGLLNVIAINVADKQYEKLKNRVEELERSQNEKKEGAK